MVITSREINAPEIIVLQRTTGKNRFDAIDDKLHNTACITLIDLRTLRARYSQHGQCQIPTHPPFNHLRPEQFVQIARLVNRSLFGDVARRQQRIDIITNPGNTVDVTVHEPGKQPGGTAKIETGSFSLTGKKMTMPIPVLLRCQR